jgi:AcrR family transcriptional regulator
MDSPNQRMDRAGPGGTRRRVVKPAETRRDELVTSAVGLFKRQGFHETTVQDIARTAGVATGTVYLYFPSKEDLLLECHRRLRQGLAAQVAGIVSSALDRAVAGEPVDLSAIGDEVVDAAVAHMLANRDLCEVCTKYVPPADPYRGDMLGFLRPLADALERGARHGLIHVPDPLTTAHLLGAALGGSLCGAVVYGSPPLERLVPASKDMFRRALAAPNG